MSTQFLNLLQQEERHIDARLTELDREKKSLLEDKQALNHFHSLQRKRQQTAKVRTVTKPSTLKRTAAQPAPSIVGKTTRRHKSPVSTMEMVRQVMNQHYEQNQRDPEMSPSQIRQEVINSFGNVRIAESMTQMLYKRSRANNTYYRTDDGRYGLLSWQGQQRAA